MTCKRSKQCDHADLCQFAKSTEYNLLGGSCFTPKDTQTNEEWLRQANKEEMEHTLTMLIMKDRFFADKEFAYVNIRFGVHCWLKEIHNDNA